MSERRSSCCGGVDEMAPEVASGPGTTEVASGPGTTEVAVDGRTSGQAAAGSDRGRSGLIQVVRRLFGIAERTGKT
jgi:hypothetical protein